MSTRIRELEDLVWSRYITERVAENMEVLRAWEQRWEEDEYAHHTERFGILSMGAGTEVLVDQALAEWLERQQKALDRLGLSRLEFIDEFRGIRKVFRQGADLDKGRVCYLGDSVYSVVWNIGWVTLFAWILPKALPNRSDVVQAGEVMLAMMYLEILYKQSVGDMYGDSFDKAVNKLEAYVRLIEEAQNRKAN